MKREIETLSELLNDYDWEEVFKYAAPTPVLGSSASGARFTRSDVAEIIGLVNGENDGPDWVGVFRLTDDRYVTLTAGCDYTGWGCQEGGQAVVATSLDELIRLGMTDDERNRLGIEQPTQEKANG